MKKYFLMLILMVMLFFPFDKVVAAVNCISDPVEITETNECASEYNGSYENSICSIGTNPNVNDTTSNVDGTATNRIKVKTTHCKKEEVCEKPTNDRVSIMVLVVDDSGSMTEERFKNARTSINKLVRKLKNLNYNDSDIRVKYFQSDNGYSLKDTELKDYTSSNLQFSKSGGETEFNTAFNAAIDFVEKVNKTKTYRPIIVFITDGYPTKINGTYNLSHLSSARYFYEAAKKLKKLKNLVKVKDGKIYTIGLDLTANDDAMAKYLLNPNATTKGNLKNNTNNESKRFYKMIVEGKTREYAELVAGIMGSSERGISGYMPESIASDHQSFKISNYDNLKNNSSSALGMNCENPYNNRWHGFAVGPIKKDESGKYKFWLCPNGNSKKCIPSCPTCEGSCNVGGPDSSDYKFIRFDIDGSDYTNFKKAEYLLFKSNKKFSYRKYKGDGAINIDGAVDYFYDNISSTKEVDWDKAINQKKLKTCRTVETCTNGEGCKDKTYNIVKEKKHIRRGLCAEKEYPFSVNGKNYKIKYVIREKITFNSGTLNNGESVRPGHGFNFSGINLNRKYDIYFKYLSGTSQYALAEDIYGNKVKIYDLGINGNKNFKNDDMRKMIFDSFKDSLNELDFYAINSNDKNSNVNSQKSKINDEYLDRQQKSTIFDTNPDILDHNDTYEAKRQRYYQDINGGIFSTNCGNQCYDGKYYFVPYGYKDSIFNVDIILKSSIKYSVSMKTTCKVNVYELGVDKLLNYRPIDLNDPFPKSNYQISNIPINWQKFYCANDNCQSNTNIQRLRNSYNNLDYEISLAKADVSKFVEDGFNYSDITGRLNDNKTSKFVNNHGYFDKVVASNKFCNPGICNSSCDCYNYD